jgi:hypothetical protein
MGKDTWKMALMNLTQTIKEDLRPTLRERYA